MLVWLDGQTNTKAKPQENFGREIMELFTVGVGNYTEPDVYAAARVFTGWNLRESEGYSDNDMNAYQEFVYNADQHDTSAKTFSFPIYPDGSKTIPARSESAGMQDGIDLITALAAHPETARRLARKFWNFFVSEIGRPIRPSSTAAANVYLQNGTDMRPVVRYIGARLAAVQRSVGASSRATRGRWSSSCARSRKWAGRASRSTTR